MKYVSALALNTKSKDFTQNTDGNMGLSFILHKKEGYIMAHLFTTSIDTIFTDAYTNNLWNVLKYLCILEMDLGIQKYFASVKIP